MGIFSVSALSHLLTILKEKTIQKMHKLPILTYYRPSKTQVADTSAASFMFFPETTDLILFYMFLNNRPHSRNFGVSCFRPNLVSVVSIQV